jgi:type IVB pilus formation R64 PilN family outer membrane protein
MPQGGAAPLAEVLDRLAARLNVSWRYENSRIEFYRLETRVFEIPSMLLDAQAEAAMGSSGAGEAQSEGSFSSASRTKLSTGQTTLIDSLRQRVEAFLSQAGQAVAVQGASASLVVTDTPEVLRRVAQYLERENRVLTRRVRILFEELTLALDDQAELGFDWQAVFNHARGMASLSTTAAMENTVGAVAAAVGRGPFQGSEALLQALGRSGKVLRRHAVPVLTLNRRPVTHAVRTTFSYIDQVQTTAMRDDLAMALPAVSVNQKTQTVGTLITLVPDAREDGRILLSVAYDSTAAQPLKVIRFGDQANPLQLQQLTVEGNGTVQQLALQPGQPLVIAGFDKTQSTSDERRLNPGVPLAFGGADAARQQKLTTLMIVTARVEED